MVTFSGYLAQEFRREGVTANVIALGLTETDADIYMHQETQQQIASLSALGRVGKPEDVARAMPFLARDDSNFVTGTYIPVYGGLYLSWMIRIWYNRLFEKLINGKNNGIWVYAMY